jgi:hypothetical protein
VTREANIGAGVKQMHLKKCLKNASSKIPIFLTLLKNYEKKDWWRPIGTKSSNPATAIGCA